MRTWASVSSTKRLVPARAVLRLWRSRGLDAIRRIIAVENFSPLVSRACVSPQAVLTQL